MPTEVRRAAVVGQPVAHSLSPVLHNAAYEALGLEWTYSRIEASAAALPGVVASLDASWVGLSVTMPGKRAALELAGSVTPRAAAVGAANTLVRKDSGGWHADCTDVDGVVGALRALPGDKGVVLGAGGTACAAVAGLASLGVSSVTIVVRDTSRAGEALRCAKEVGVTATVLSWAQADFGAIAAASAVVVNTTPAEAVLPHAAALAEAPCVLDVIYHPWPTPLAEAVERRGGRVVTGLDMLLHQAFGQVEQFTGQPAPREAMRTALRAATGNVVPL